MAFENEVFDISFLAAGDLSDYQYHFVKLSANNTVTVCTGAADRAIGILQNEPSAAGQVARVRIMGISRVYVGTSGLAVATTVGTDASGHAIAKTLDKAWILGICVNSGLTTETASMILYPPRTLSV